jgi:hypothetical protein
MPDVCEAKAAVDEAREEWVDADDRQKRAFLTMFVVCSAGLLTLYAHVTLGGALSVAGLLLMLRWNYLAAREAHAHRTYACRLAALEERTRWVAWVRHVADATEREAAS